MMKLWIIPILIFTMLFSYTTTMNFIDMDLTMMEDWDDDVQDTSQSLLMSISSNPNTSLTDRDTKCQSTPSATCRLIVEKFGWAISNYTLCSVKNARPIHLCEVCVMEYINVTKTHKKFQDTIDEDGNICQDYFTNLDRLQIVSEAYRYVHHLWRKANCNSCFKRDENGTMNGVPTDETRKFDTVYKQTKRCFKRNIENENLTCVNCLKDYQNLTDTYIDIQNGAGDSICMDIVDTMNITRWIWSNKYNCVKRQGVSTPLKIVLGLITLIPLTFYISAYVLSNRQESPILQQKRLGEVFAINSNSGFFGGAEYGLSRTRSPTPQVTGIFNRHR